MYAWTISNVNSSVIDILKFTLKNGHHEKIIKPIEDIIKFINTSGELKIFLNCGIDICKIHTNDHTLSFLLEMLSSLEYTIANEHSGKLKLITETIKKESVPALKYMKRWCKNAIKQKEFLQQDCWFNIRVHCMDVYCLIHMFNLKFDEAVFYGGDLHAKNAYKCLLRNGAQITKVPEDIFLSTHGSNILSINAVELYGKKITLIGENHNQTQTNFADNFLNVLKTNYCKNKHKNLTVFIEKHISNNKDQIQRQLTCNMQNMAIHKFRCDYFIENNDCIGMKVIPVDNRHYDLGFLRKEMMDLWYLDINFQKCAQNFQEKSLYDLYYFSKKMLFKIYRR